MLHFTECLLILVVCTNVRTLSLSRDPDRFPTGLSRVAARNPLREAKQDTRLLLPTPQELEALRKVAQVLVMLGEQVIPAIIGNSPGMGRPTTKAPEVPNDPVQIN